jgi:hypothetical protein
VRNKVQFKERSARRAIRAARKEGLAINSVEIGPDGTIRVLARASDQQIEDREVNEWDRDYGKPAA